MLYTINRYGQPPINVPEGTINVSTSVTLVGKNYVDYGQFLDQNSMTLLQNSAGLTPPVNPQYGQLWWNAGDKVLNVFDGKNFKSLTSSIASTTPPVNPSIGDMWFNTVDETLSIYNGGSWILIGPTVVDGTGAQAAVIEDNTGLKHNVVEILVGSTIVGIISKDNAFTPLRDIPGFPTVGPGYNVATVLNNIDQYYNGTATNALALQGYDPNDFMSSLRDTGTMGSISANSNSGLTTGYFQNFSFYNASIDGVIQNKVLHGNILIDLNVDGNITNVVTFYGANGNVSFAGDITAPSIHANTIVVDNIVGGYGNSNVVALLNDPGSSSNIKTSKYFIGDGRYITNISSANVTGAYGDSNVSFFLSSGLDNSNIITSAYFIGDGSRLTRINPMNINPGPGIVRVVNTGVGLIGGPINESGTISLQKSISANAGVGGTIGGVIPDGVTIQIDNTGIISTVDGNYGNANVDSYLKSGSVTNIGIGTAVPSGSNGSLYVANEVFAYGTSDIKYKSNITPILNALEAVDAIGGHEFDWSEEYLMANGGENENYLHKHDFGVIAQDVKQVFPMAVRERIDGSLAVDYQKLSVLALAAIKELNALVQELRECVKHTK